MFQKPIKKLNQNTVFISLKGYGDFVILAHYISKSCCSKSHVLIISKKLEKLARILLQDEVDIIVLDQISDTFSAYDIRRSYLKLTKESFYLRKTLKSFLTPKQSLLIDFSSIRNKLIFSGIKHHYLPKSNNIYNSYETYFNYTNDNSALAKKLKPKSVLLFPFGSSSDRDIPSYYMNSIIEYFCVNKIAIKIAVHTTHIEKIDNSLIKYTQEFNDEESLVNLIKETELLISVDTIAIHLAQFFNISTIILSSSWKKFIPPNLIANNRLFGINKPIDLFNALDAAT